MRAVARIHGRRPAGRIALPTESAAFGSLALPRPAADEAPASGRRRWPVAALLIAIVCGCSALIAARERVVRLFPATAAAFRLLGAPVNPFGLELQGLQARVEWEGSRKVLIAEGEIVNLRPEPKRAPRLALSVRDSNGFERYVWTALSPKTRLEAKERVAFRARLASPPEEGMEVLVRFARGESL